MSVRDDLDRIVDQLPEERLSELVDFARFLTLQEEQRAWREFGREQLARAYGPDEPEYTEADIKPELDR